MKTIISTICAVSFASFASVAVAKPVQETGFVQTDQAASSCKYVKKSDRKRDLKCIH